MAPLTGVLGAGRTGVQTRTLRNAPSRGRAFPAGSDTGMGRAQNPRDLETWTERSGCPPQMKTPS